MGVTVGSYLALFEDGPVGGQVLFAQADPVGPLGCPARWQQFFKPVKNRFGFLTGRTGVFLYELSSPEPSRDLVWTYHYVQYGEEYHAL